MMLQAATGPQQPWYQIGCATESSAGKKFVLLNTYNGMTKMFVFKEDIEEFDMAHLGQLIWIAEKPKF